MLSVPSWETPQETSFNPLLHNLISFMTLHFCGKTSPTASPHLLPWWTSQDHIWPWLKITVYLIWHWIFLFKVSFESGGKTLSQMSPNDVCTCVALIYLSPCSCFTSLMVLKQHKHFTVLLAFPRVLSLLIKVSHNKFY